MALTPWSLVRFGRLGLLMLPLVAASCGGREFHTEREVFAHFKQHRQGFQQAAEVFLVMQTRAVEIPDVVPRENENPLVRLAQIVELWLRCQERRLRASNGCSLGCGNDC